jgi:hypothetical protein
MKQREILKKAEIYRMVQKARPKAAVVQTSWSEY